MRSDTPREAAFGTPPEAAFGTPSEALLSRLPPIRRARGFRLYDVKGRRYLDLSREGALLGHRGEGTLTAMKSVLSQGLVAALPSIWEQRLAGALARQFPAYAEIRLYASPERARRAAARYVGDPGAVVADPALTTRSEETAAAYWRPFLPLPRARVLLPLLPVTVNGAPSPVCFDEEPRADVPPSDRVPGFILAAAVRGFLALPSASLSLPRLERALDRAVGWARTGPYVRAVFPESDYASVHEEFLREGVLLAPGYPGPSVLPGDCSSGEAQALVDLFTRIPGG
ncbi:MAG TPA: hypothetical protein VFI08_09445 [Spirochaetia bacterium]|nr:hypothetical protein [Spirochaetia bacterium]